jgi:hypothetical protein
MHSPKLLRAITGHPHDALVCLIPQVYYYQSKEFVRKILGTNELSFETAVAGDWQITILRLRPEFVSALLRQL